MSTRKISPLRQRMIEDMEARQLSAATQKVHLNSCERFATFLGRSPETATPDDIRRFQHHLSDAGVSIITRNRIMTGVKRQILEADRRVLVWYRASKVPNNQVIASFRVLSTRPATNIRLVRVKQGGH